MFRTALKEYLVNTTFHGLRFIAQQERHWTERIFWLICVLISWYGSAYLIKSSWIASENNPINFGVETTYLDWNTEFPSVVVCEESDIDRVVDILGRTHPQYYDEDAEVYERRFDVEETFNEIAFYSGSSYYVTNICFQNGVYDDEVKCPTTNFSSVAKLFRMNCTELFEKCEWNNVQFDCCTYFVPLETEYGTCFAINNLNSRIKTRFHMVSNRSTGLGTLYLYLNAKRSRIYVLSQEGVPHLTTRETDRIKLPLGCIGEYYVKVNEISNQPEVRDVDISKRRCRFRDENYLEVYPVYSSSACVVNCRKNLQLELCNCTSYYMPNVDPKLYCNIDGLVCLGKHINKMRVRKTAWSTKEDAFFCPCDENCDSSSVSFVRWLQDLQSVSKSGKGELILKLDHLPIEQFRRTVVRGKLDLVVSMGGAAGLFVGASLLSFAELIYHFTLRMFVTMRYYRNKYGNGNSVPLTHMQVNSNKMFYSNSQVHQEIHPPNQQQWLTTTNHNTMPISKPLDRPIHHK